MTAVMPASASARPRSRCRWRDRVNPWATTANPPEGPTEALIDVDGGPGAGEVHLLGANDESPRLGRRAAGQEQEHDEQ